MVSNLLTEIDNVGDRVSSPRFSRRTKDVRRNTRFESVTMFKPICAQLPRCEKENLEPTIELAVADAVAFVVSESAMVRVFGNGSLLARIIPELWLLSHHKIQLCGPYLNERAGDIAVLLQAS